MYIRLGNININYSPSEIDNFILVSQVVSSPITYEKPVFVKNTKELSIWFGTGYREEDYLKELLQNGVGLWITSAISSTESSISEDYISYSNWDKVGTPISSDQELLDNFIYIINGKEYLINTNISSTYETITEESLLEVPSYGSYLVFNGYDELPDIGEINKTYVKSDRSYYIWTDLGIGTFGWINVDELPQNISNFASEDLTNRDTLYLYEDGTYSTPKYLNQTSVSVDNINITNLDLERVEEGYQTLVFNIDIGEVPEVGDYLVLEDSNGVNNLLYVGTIPEDLEGYYEISHEITIEDYSNSIVNTLTSIGYFLIDNKLYSKSPVSCNYFYKMGNGFSMTPSYLETHNVINKIKQGSEVIRFWSKTLGNGGIDGDISIEIDDEFIKISRFDYSETFNFAEESDICSSIYNNSKLLYCEGTSNYGNWPKGSYSLKGSFDLGNKTTEDYKKSLSNLINERETVEPDFILIDSISDYGILSEEDMYWEDLINLSISSNSQVLIQNSTTDYINNYKKDLDNRLIYFYNSMSSNGVYKPGYYVFLNGLISDNYSVSTSEVLYDSPVKEVPSIDSNNLINALELNKSNYLIDSGQYYYYKSYLDGVDYNTSSLMRFVIGKITREIEKIKWEIISEREVGKALDKLSSTLGNIRKKFSIIRQLNMTNFSISEEGDYLEISITTVISDLVKNSINLDIQINYNKLNN